MLIRVEHSLNYAYSNLVSLSPHYIYLRPKISPYQELRNYVIDINPIVSKLIKNIDSEGNVQHIAYFSGLTNNLQIKTQFEIESQAFNAFEFIFLPFSAEQLPFQYVESEKTLLQPYLNLEDVSTTIHQFARQLAAEVSWKTIAFLTHITSYISVNFLYEKRIDGFAFSAEKTLLARKGTCRDYAVLMISACKALGLAARFVSGYAYGSPEQAHELHAWVEVYLPGGGWRGFDPTGGKVADNQYISLASSAQPQNISPITGTFGNSATSTLDTLVSIQKLV